jgi:ATP-dependent DNA helicase RecG
MRLKSLAKTEDGFETNELDLKIRGRGDLTGFRQSGEEFYLINKPLENEKLFEFSNEFARIIYSKYTEEEILKIFNIPISLFNVLYKDF